MGDGGLVYFGYPQAHEHDPERAVRAGLAIVKAIRNLERVGDHALQIRVGIATGPVVVGEVIGTGELSDRDVSGEAPNLAARLQSLAEPNSVVIAAATKHLVGDAFEYRPLGDVKLKGFAGPIGAYHVLGVSRTKNYLEAQRANEPVPLIGRGEEMGLLLRQWSRAKSRQGQIILVSGEPGIGKSRLAQALLERIACEPHLHLRYFCSPYHRNSALYAVLAQIEHAACFGRGDTPEVKLEKLARVFQRVPLKPGDLGLPADLLMLPTDGPDSPAVLPAGKRKQALMEMLLRHFESLAASQPVLVIFEDVQWIDPTSRELLDMIIDGVPFLPVLFVITYRPEFQLPWSGLPNTTSLLLARLNRQDSKELIGEVAGKRGLPDGILEQIMARTDGVPLFIEELTRSVIEIELRESETDKSAEQTSKGIPVTLQASLMARLDQIPVARPIAQVGAAIGREFSFEMLAAVTLLPEPDLVNGLALLTDSGLVHERGRSPNATYRFKHALVRDAAYNTLLRTQRRELHARIGHVLETQFSEIAEAQPDLVAQHFTEARAIEKALDYWEIAGRLSMKQSAMSEAAANLQTAIELLPQLPDTAHRQKRELALQIGLGSALIAATGYTSPTTGQVYARAHALSEQLMDAENLIRVSHGLWSFHAMRGEMGNALQVATELLDRSEDPRFSALKLTAHRLLGAGLVQLGRLNEALEHLETAERLLATERCSGGVWRARVDDLVGVPAYLSVVLALMGFYDQARAKSAAALEESRRTFRPHRHAFALGVAGYWFHLLLNEETMDLADELAALAAEHGFPYWSAFALQFRGVSLARTGRAEEGVALVMEGIRQHRSIGATWSNEVFLGAVAEFAPVEQALGLVNQALHQVVLTHITWFLPELHRIKATLLMQSGHGSEAEKHYLQAIKTARNQGSRHWELRGAVCLAMLWNARGRRTHARELVAPIYGAFTEGDNTSDRRHAAALLARLANANDAGPGSG
jgi:tetratricopeptide (TPR) repeat protein